MTTNIVARVERRREVANMRLAGVPWPEIAEKLGVAISTVHNDLRQALAEIPAEAVEAYREQELERLDDLWREERSIARVAYERFSDESLDWEKRRRAADLALRAHDRLINVSAGRRLLLGTDAPQRRIVEVVDENVLRDMRANLGPELQALKEEFIARGKPWVDPPMFRDGEIIDIEAEPDEAVAE